MKRTLVLGALFTNALLGLGCDQCGCGLLLGIRPFDRANNFGLQYRMRYLHGDMPTTEPVLQAKHGGMATGAGTTTRMASFTEVYYAIDLQGQFWLARRWSLLANLPLVNNYATMDNVQRADVYGMGDPTAVLRYVVYNTRMLVDTLGLRQRFSVGFGAKLPLAQHDVQQYGETLDHDLQPGTGTWDAILSAEYSVRGRHTGVSLITVGRYNGTMDDGYQQGHSLNTALEVFRVMALKGFQLVPSAGAYTEVAMPDRMNDVAQAGTGGSVVFSHLSTRLWWGAFGLSLTWQHALINGEGAMMVPNRERFLAGINYNFNKRN